MTFEKNRISAPQLFCMLMLSRLSAEIVYPRTQSGAAVEAISALVISELVRFALALPLIVYSFKGSDIHGAVTRGNRFFGWCGGLFSAALLTCAAFGTLLYTSEFTVKNLLIGGAMWSVFIISAVFAVYAAVMGTEALARAGAIFIVAAVLITAVVILADIPYMKVNAVVGGGSFDDFLGELGNRIMRGGDYLIFAALLPYVNRRNSASSGKCVLMFALFSVLSAVLITVVNCLVLRELYGQTGYPFIAAASLSDIAFFKRLDAAAAAMWMLCAVFRSGVMLLAAWKTLLAVRSASRRAPGRNGGVRNES